MRGMAAIGALLLAACATDVQRYSDIDQSNKTVTVPAGGAGLTGKIKSGLTQAGWQMVVYRGPEVTRGTVGEEVRLARGNTFNSRYNLIVEQRRVDLCLNLEPEILYDISLIDNRSGAEVITMSGRGCESRVANTFLDQLN
jgi:hypothetical protein